MDMGMWNHMPPHMRERLMYRMSMLGDVNHREMFGGDDSKFDHGDDMGDGNEDMDVDTDVNEDDDGNEDNEQPVVFNQDFDDQPSYHIEDKNSADIGTDINGDVVMITASVRVFTPVHGAPVC